MLVELVVQLTLASGPAGASPVSSAPRRYDDHVVIRVPADRAAETLLAPWARARHDVPRQGRWEAVVPANAIAPLRRAGLEVEVVEPDLQDRIDAERHRLATPPVPAGNWFSDFKDLDQIWAYLDTLAGLAPDVEVSTLGPSIEGRDIRAISLGSAASRSVVVLGTQHAREWASPMVTTCLADSLIRDRDTNPTIRQVADRLHVVFVPVVNPDGYAYTWNRDRLWRKNRRAGGGVDLNRNWDVEWGLGTQGASPGSDIYPGSGPFSEPETRAVRDLILDQIDLAAVVDVHSPVNLVLYPFAFPTEATEMDPREESWAEAMAETITAVHGVSHGARQPGRGNPSGGLAQDWAASATDALAWTVEVRGASTGGSGGGFVLPPEQIVPACEENLAGFLELAQHLLDEDPSGGTGGTSSTGDPGSTGDTGETSGSGPGGTTSGGPPGGMSPTSGDAGSSTSSTGPATDSDDPGGEAEAAGTGGCGCRSRAGKGHGAWWLGVLLLASRRSRRKAKSPSTAAKLHGARAPPVPRQNKIGKGSRVLDRPTAPP